MVSVDLFRVPVIKFLKGGLKKPAPATAATSAAPSAPAPSAPAALGYASHPIFSIKNLYYRQGKPQVSTSAPMSTTSGPPSGPPSSYLPPHLQLPAQTNSYLYKKPNVVNTKRKPPSSLEIAVINGGGIVSDGDGRPRRIPDKMEALLSRKPPTLAEIKAINEGGLIEVQTQQKMSGFQKKMSGPVVLQVPKGAIVKSGDRQQAVALNLIIHQARQ